MLEDMDRPGFFKEYYKSVRKTVTNEQLNTFAKLANDEEKIRFVYEQIPAVHDIEVRTFYNGKSERDALERKEIGNKAFGRKKNLEALRCYSQAVVKAPVLSGKYWKLISWVYVVLERKKMCNCLLSHTEPALDNSRTLWVFPRNHKTTARHVPQHTSGIFKDPECSSFTLCVIIFVLENTVYDHFNKLSELQVILFVFLVYSLLQSLLYELSLLRDSYTTY